MAAPAPGKPRETGKERWSRIPLDYYKHPDHLERWKGILGAAALVLALAWWGIGLAWDSARGGLGGGSLGRLRASHGELARAHAPWESNCEVCHVPLRPIRGDVWAAAWSGGASASDRRCQACHAGPAHHACELETPPCASCHRDHRGKEASLVRLPDSDCTSCHSNLLAHIKPDAQCARSSQEYAAFKSISRFDVDHPEFRALQAGRQARDPGNLLFNHALHMSAGMALAPDSKPVFVLAMIADPAERKRYARRGQNDTAPVQLDCGSCHRTDSGDLFAAASPELATQPPGGPAPVSFAQLTALPSGLLPVRSSGEYMQPITYELHCQPCHELRVESPSGSPRGTRPITIRHRLQPAALHATIEQAYIAMLLESGSVPSEPAAPARSKPPVPARGPAEGARTYLAERVLEKEKALFLEKRLTDADKILFLGKQTCGECHVFNTPSGTVQLDLLRAGSAPSFELVPPRIPQVWFAQSLFDHAAHRAIDCRECHAAAYPDASRSFDGKAVKPSTKSEDVLVPGIVTCRACHAPRGRERGGAAFNCTECHRYHDGDHPLQGKGAAGRDALERRSIQEFLSGASKRKGL
ncbi:MAG TPA: cytochrome c3 family protein [Isosphaeraceae bacterium]|jgi:hypothetical protein|nr:cytochrome c3 family protein [Isosphaeraceae bacterium]